MNHLLSLFSGIGGLDLAAEWAGFRTVAFVERDPYCQRVLAKRWPGVPILSDVRAVKGQLLPDAAGDGDSQSEQALREHDERGLCGRPEVPAHAFRRGDVAIVSGGFPCQPHSVAGKRQASADDRDLWPEFARVIREIRPRWVVAENVPGLLHSESGRFFGAVLGDLADMGYRAGWGVWGACDVGALHRRERVFIVAYDPHAVGVRELQPEGGERHERGRFSDLRSDVADADGCDEHGRSGYVQVGRLAVEGEAAWACDPTGAQWGTEPQVGRVVDGISGRVDRLRALGNAVVPQQAYPLFAEIARIEGMRQTPPEINSDRTR